MEPAFYRGDLLFLVNPPNKRYETGDITVYRIPGQDIPIVHRVLETHDVVKTVNGFVLFPPLRLRGSGRLSSARSVREATPLPENQLLLTKGRQ
jgi:signal peptidase